MIDNSTLDAIILILKEARDLHGDSRESLVKAAVKLLEKGEGTPWDSYGGR